MPESARAPLSINRLLILCFVLLATLILVGGAIAIWQSNVAQRRAQLLYQADQPAVAVLIAHSDFQSFQTQLKTLLEAHDAGRFIESANTLREAFNKDIARAHAAMGSLSSGPDRDRQFIALEAIQTQFSSQIDALIGLVRSGDWSGALLRLQSRDPIQATLSENLVHDIDALVAEQKDQALMGIRSAGQRAIYTLLVVAIATLIFTGALGLGVIRRIAGRLRQLDVAVNALGRGEFGQRVEVSGEDEIARLAQAFNQMSEHLSGLYEALRRSEAYFRSLIENASDFIVVLDKDCGVRYASPSLERDFAGNASLMGRNFLELVAEEDRAALKASLDDLQPQVVSNLMQFRIGQDPSAARILEASATNLLGDTVVKGIILNARDATERGKLEKQISRSQRMEAIGKLAGGVAHDFNNILTVILGHTGLLLESFGGVPELHGRLEVIDDASKRAASLTRQLLAFSRQQVLLPRVFNLNPLITDLEKMLRRLVPEDIELKTALEPKLSSTKADPTQIQQVIMNLVLNARDAIKRGGQIVVETANVDLDETYVHLHQGATKGPHVMLAVSDTGEGMSQNILQHIFEPFFTTKEPGMGTGLGLSTVYGIVKQSGGHIWVYSEVGQGTTFKVYFPTVYDPLDAVAEPVATVGKSHGETILLVEDEPDLRELIENVLTAHGYSVISLPSPLQAELLVKNHKGALDLLLTDVIMPGMRGPQLAEHLLKLRPAMKVLFMSGYTSNSITDLGSLEDRAHFLEKPFVPTTLLLKVKETLGKDGM
ncbi:MAG: response regulator [Acidobacteria bacterium]|nr:response regulator [Acidobacteriota bacterium]MBS1867416.1 response regulator [Acidobacteriota bacterium]